jgi:hypothetical protein
LKLKFNFIFKIVSISIADRKFPERRPAMPLNRTAILPSLFLAFFTFSLFVTASAAAQSAEQQPIQDNSFLIEEAYNQEPGVVQHINTFTRLWNSEDWVYTFTQEWPLPMDWRHQLSYTLAGVSSGSHPAAGAGFGDIALNYRYQLVGNGETRTAFAPRLTLLLPSGSAKDGRGVGGVGWQANLPLSVVVNRSVVTHWNLGGTLVPRARDGAGHHATASGYNFGQSIIWLMRPNFNLMLETAYSGSQSVIGQERTTWANSLLVSPGIRWAWNLSHGLQIVPGIAVPVGVGPSHGDKGIYAYLSFEHPFRNLPSR